MVVSIAKTIQWRNRQLLKKILLLQQNTLIFQVCKCKIFLNENTSIFFHVQRDISRYVVKRKRDINFPIISPDS